jgi:2-dehydropantoate 2-reductase
MKFVIAGAGAIGAYLGARMHQAGHDVSLFARGPHLRAMQERGVRVIGDAGEFTVRPPVSGSLEEIGPADVVILGVKAHGLTALVPQLHHVLGADTTVVSTQNGVPWWFFGGRRIERVDPDGAIAAAIELRRVLGSIVYFSTEIAEPGVIRHISGDRISIGEPDGTRSERARRIAEVLVSSGLRAPVTTHIREEIWVKILGNMAFNPISALTGATLVRMVRHPEVAQVVRGIMQEGECIAARLGMKLPVSIEQRIAGAEKVGEHKTSMLQDWEAGRPLELEPMVGAVLELGEKLGVPMPYTRTVYACARLMEKRRVEAA